MGNWGRRRWLLIVCVSGLLGGCSAIPSDLQDKVQDGIEHAGEWVKSNKNRKKDAGIINGIIDYSNINLWDDAVKKGVKLNGYMHSTFRYAYEHGTADFAYYILDHGVDLGYRDGKGRTELMYLAGWKYSARYEKMLKKMVSNGCDPSAVDKGNHNAIEYAILVNDDRNNLMTARKIAAYYENGVPLRLETVGVICENRISNYAAIKYVSDKIKEEGLELKVKDCIEAAFIGDMDYLMKHKEDWKKPGDVQTQVLFYIAALGKLEDFQKCIEITGNSFEIQDKLGNTLLMASAFTGNEEIFHYLFPLIEHDTISSTGETLLTAAVAGGNENIINQVIEDGTDFTEPELQRKLIDEGAWEQFAQTLSCSENEKVLSWSINFCAWPDYCLETFCSYLVDQDDMECCSAVFNDPKIVRLIQEDSSFAKDILSLSYKPEEMRLILQYVPDSMKEEMGLTLAEILGRNYQILLEDSAQVVQIFYDYGVPLDRDGKAWIPLISAAEVGDAAAVEELIRCGTNINQRENKEGRSALHTTAVGDYVLMEVLLKAGADADIIDKNGETPLMWAAKGGSKECVNLLLEYGADKQIQNKEGKTAYDLAIEQGQDEIADLVK